MPVTAVRDEGALRMWVCRLPVHIGPLGSCEFAGDFIKISASCGRTESSAPRVYLKTPNAPGQRAFLRCAASFFLEIRQYSCEKMSCATQKSLAAGHIMSFQIHPNRRFPVSSITENRKLRHKNMEALGFFLTRFFRTYSGNIFESVLI